MVQSFLYTSLIQEKTKININAIKFSQEVKKELYSTYLRIVLKKVVCLPVLYICTSSSFNLTKLLVGSESVLTRQVKS